MKKILAMLMVIAMALPTMSVSAKETAVIPAFDVHFNGNKVESNYRQFPLIVYKDITYVPMTYYDCRFLGLTTSWDNDTRTLSIEKSGITCAYRDYNWQWKNNKNNEASVCDFNIVVNGKEVDNSKEAYPLLTFRDVTYFPLTWRFAVDEFGWEYNFDSENGLVITSDNPHVETINLPKCEGSIATDGQYYYYNGNDGDSYYEGKYYGDKYVIYRTPVNDLSKAEIIYEMPPTGRRAGFSEAEGNIYFKYFAGHSAVTGSMSFCKIEKNGSVTEDYRGSVTEGYPPYHYYGKHGRNQLQARENGISVIGIEVHIQSATEFTYTIDGVETKVEPIEEGLTLGQRRNGIKPNYVTEDCIKIFGDKIYYTAYSQLNSENSNLYVIDTKTGKTTKLIEGVCGFHVYTGWVDELRCDSTMIIYDSNGILMRYTEINGDVRKIEDNGEEGMLLCGAVGSQTVYTVQKDLYGKKTIVKAFDCYANGTGSRKGTVFETTTGTFYKKFTDKLCVYTNGESANDEVRFFVADEGNHYRFSDSVGNVFVYDDILLYTFDNGLVARVDLK